MCRAALNATCDTAEVCTGASASCPADVTVKDGTSCGSGLACASGQCTSLSRAYRHLFHTVAVCGVSVLVLLMCGTMTQNNARTWVRR